MIPEMLQGDIKEIILKHNFDMRAYQFEIIESVLNSIKNGESTIINIPQGLGKTFISQAIAVVAQSKLLSRDAKFLFLVPTRALRIAAFIDGTLDVRIRFHFSHRSR